MPHPEETYRKLGNGPLWETIVECLAALEKEAIPHAIAGGVAVCFHGYPRNTADLDLIIRPEDTGRVRAVLAAAGFHWNENNAVFLGARRVPVQFLVAGNRAGDDSEVKFPDPADEANLERIEKMPVLSLAKLIEGKIACGEGNLRRTYKDFADVVELIAIHSLNSSFARKLHKSLRPTFRRLLKNARGKA